MPYVNNKDADLPAHPCSPICVFVVRFQDSTISIVAISKIPRLSLASEAEQLSLSLYWSQTSKEGFLMMWRYSSFCTEASSWNLHRSSHFKHYLCQLMRFWHFLPSVNSDFWSDPSSIFILHVCKQQRLWHDYADTQARLSLRWSPMW